MAWRFAPPHYVQGRQTKNQNHWLWRLNKLVSDPWINDYIKRSRDLEKRARARDLGRQMEDSVGVRMIAEERERQVKALGWTAERDDELYPGGH